MTTYTVEHHNVSIKPMPHGKREITCSCGWGTTLGVSANVARKLATVHYLTALEEAE